MASEKEIAEGLESLFREVNPNSFTSLNDVVLRLQSKLGGLDLSNNIDFIRAHLTLLFSLNPNPNPNPNPNLHHPHQQQQAHVYHHHQQQIQQIQHQQQQIQQQHRVAQSQFPTVGTGFGGGGRGPTEISFAQPGGSVADSHSSVPVKESTQTKPKRRGGPGGLNKLCGVSPLLQTIVGQPAMPRTEIVKQLWAYIRKHKLQDPSNKRKIICNDELRLVFETDSTDMFQMNKLLAKHIVSLNAKNDSEQKSKKLKVEESQVPCTEPAPAPAFAPALDLAPAPASAPVAAPATVSNPAPTPASGSSPASDLSPIVISEALAKFFGTSEKEMLQSEVYKRVEEYIKVEGLEDQMNSVVICDRKLQDLFGCESIPTPGIREALARNHLFQRA